MPIARSPGPLRLIHGSLSSKKVARQYPLLAGFHKVTDGALLGVLIGVVMMSALSLHWRHLWISAYRQLEATRDLTQKLSYSTAMLEQHLLKRTSLPLSMVRTNAEKLHYLENPEDVNSSFKVESTKKNLLRKLSSYSVKYGY